MTPPEPSTIVQRSEPSLWDFVLPLGNGDPQTAVGRADEVDRLGLALTNPRLEARSREFVGALQKGLIDFDLGKLWGLLPARSGEKKRTLPVVGRNRGASGYHLTFFPTGSEPPGEPLGRLNGSLSLEPVTLPVTGRSGYRADGSGQIGMSHFTSRQIARAGERLLAIVELATHTSLWRRIDEALPRTAPFFRRFVTVDGRQTDIRHDARHGSYLECDLTLRLNVEAFRGPYPDLHEYLEELGDLFHFTGDVWDNGGQSLVHFEADSESHTLRIRFFAKDGAILPSDKSGKPAGTGIRLSEVRQDRFVITVRGTVKKYGTTFHLRNYPITISLNADENRALFSTVIKTPPQIDVGDRVFYLIPQAIADWFVPGTIAEHTRAFFEAVARGPDGKGSRIEGEMIDGTNGAESLWQGAAHVAVLDNLLVKLALRTVAENLLPQDDATKDADRFVNELYRRLSADYHTARPLLLSRKKP